MPLEHRHFVTDLGDFLINAAQRIRGRGDFNDSLREINLQRLGNFTFYLGELHQSRLSTLFILKRHPLNYYDICRWN